MATQLHSYLTGSIQLIHHQLMQEYVFVQVSFVSPTLFGGTSVKHRNNVTISSTSVWKAEITAAASGPAAQITKTVRVKEL